MLEVVVVCVSFIKHHIHIQPLLVGILTGEEKSEEVCKYITCPKFRATMKAKSLGNLLDMFDSMEVFIIAFLSH